MRRNAAATIPSTRWLKRLRRELAVSGRGTQLALQLASSHDQDLDPAVWRQRLRAICTGTVRPDPELILRLEALLARPHAEAAPATQQRFAF